MAALKEPPNAASLSEDVRKGAFVFGAAEANEEGREGRGGEGKHSALSSFHSPVYRSLRAAAAQSER